MAKNNLLLLGLGGFLAYSLLKKSNVFAFDGVNQPQEVGYVVQTPITSNYPTQSSAASMVVAEGIKSGQLLPSSLPKGWTSKSATTKENITAVLAPSGSKNLFSDAVLKQLTKEANK